MHRYNPLHPKLLEARHAARQVTYRFNNLDPNSGNHEEVGEKQAKLLAEILGSVGEGTFIEPPFLPDYGCNVKIGKNCFFNFGSVFTLVRLSVDSLQLIPAPQIDHPRHKPSHYR